LHAGIAAVISVNVLLTVYVLLAFIEENDDPSRASRVKAD